MNLFRPILLAAFAIPAFAVDAPRALPQGQLPDDVRLQPLKDLDGYFPWKPLSSREAWATRAEQLRTQVRVALGVFPEPTKTPLKPVIHGKVDRDDYTVERVYFESMPGFFVTGSLYRPKKEGKHPAVLCPHGHWNNGRFYEDSEAGVKKTIASGGEVSPVNGRVPLQSRCATLARMGCVVFHYDMLGYADSQQIGEMAHKFAKQRPEANAREGWGLFSPQAETHAQSIMGLQTWNSIRALDFLTSLPDVDGTRIGCTGASGGGTQTFILAAIEPRITAAFPAVMVSTAMQGGCTCENASLLRVGTGNIELAALFAPKPMGMTGADDWTKEMPTKGFPDLAAHWAMMGAPQNVKLFHRPEFPHNYNLPSRLAMYEWFNQHLGLGVAKIEEREIVPLKKEEMTVWDAEHPAPAGGLDFEKQLCRWWSEDADKQLAAADPKAIAKPAIEAIFQRALATEKATMDHSTFKKDARGEWLLMRGIIENVARKEALPTLFVHPKKWSGRTVVWLSEKGKAGVLGDDGQPTAEVQQLVASGASVIGVDLFMQGEFAFGQEGEVGNRKVKNPREAAAFTYGYNHSLFAQRVHDVLSVLAFTRDHPEHHSTHVALIALDGTAPIAAAARALSGTFVNATAINTHGFRFGGVDRLNSPWFQPAIAKYGDLPAVLKVGQGALWVDGEGTSPAQTAVNWLLAQ